MPVVKEQIYAGVAFTWYGDRITERVRDSIRGALEETGREAVKAARAPGRVRRDTDNLAANIEHRVPRAKNGEYTLQFGVFADSRGPQLRNQPAVEYAFWQEVLPVAGRPYIRPSMDEQVPQMAARIAKRLRASTSATLDILGERAVDVGFDQ